MLSSRQLQMLTRHWQRREWAKNQQFSGKWQPNLYELQDLEDVVLIFSDVTPPSTVTARIIPFLSFGDPFTRLYIQPLFGRGSIFTYAIRVKAKTEEGGWRDLEGSCAKKHENDVTGTSTQKVIWARNLQGILGRWTTIVPLQNIYRHYHHERLQMNIIRTICWHVASLWVVSGRDSVQEGSKPGRFHQRMVST